MIVFSRNYWFGGRVSTIHTSQFNCMVSTAKEGLFKKQSTMIVEIREEDKISERRAVAKLIYTPSMRTSDRLQMHDAVVKMLDVQGEAGEPFSDIIQNIITNFRSRGIIIEGMTVA